MKKIVNKIFPCDEKLKIALDKHKEASSNLIVEIREATDRTLKDFEKDVRNVK